MSSHSAPGSAKSTQTNKSAVEKVEDYLRAESRMSQVEKPPAQEGESKGAYCWRLIRHCVRHAVDVVTKAEAKDVIVGHGVHHRRRINHLDCLQQVIYNRKTREYLTVDGKEIRVYRTDGRRQHTVPLVEDPLNRLIYATQANLYVGWIYEDDLLVLMTADFEVTSVSEAPGPILAAVYNENIGEIVTVGAGFLTSWVFRYGGRHLLPRKTIEDGLDPDDKYSLLVLEETASRSQKAFAACGTSVAVMNLFEGKLLEIRRELHVRTITALLFFNPLKYLVTAAKDGSIKVWDDKWHLQVVFVGHGGAVSALAVYPCGPLIMSASHDKTIRVWSLETCDEVDKVETDEPALSLITVVNHDNLASMSSSHADLWKVHNIHMLHANIGHKVEHLKSTDHPEHPVRILLMCRDASVRILSPATGDILTTLLGDPRLKVVDAAYAIEDNIMFAVHTNGDIVKCDTSTNPCRVIGHWKCHDQKKRCNYLLVYEYVITADITNDTWAGMKRAIATRGIGTDTSNNKTGKGANRTLLLGGRQDGHICVFNWSTGAVDFEIEAHGHKGVLSMIANSKNDQLISAGLDNIIKIWRLYPYAQESLAPLMSFYCAHTPIYMTVMRSKLVVAFQEHASATYSVVMYNLNRRNRHDHGPEDDHLDSITGLTSCNKLRLVASCSMDGTVRIWNEVNNLVRILKLNAVPHSLCFCTQRGDLLVGIGDHVHRIDHKDYLPKSYRLKMVSIQFAESPKEKPVPYDEELLEDMNRDDVKRLKAARSSFKFSHFVDILTQEETDEVMREKRQREAAFSALEQRENELNLIKTGGLKARRRPKPTAATKREAFDKYLSIFYTRNQVKLVDEDPFAAEMKVAEEERDDGRELLLPTSSDDDVDRSHSEEPDTYRPEHGASGFFPEEPSTARPEARPPVRSDGFVPNSVLVHLLWPDRKAQEQKRIQEQAERWVPPSLNLEQLNQIANLNKGTPPSRTPVCTPVQHKEQQKRRSSKNSESRGSTESPTKPDSKHGKSKSKTRESSQFRESPLFMEYSDDEEETKPKDEDEEEEEEDFSKPPAALMGSLMAKVEQAMEKSPSPELELPPAMAREVAAAATAAALTENGSPVPQPPKPQREVKARKPLVKFVSRPSKVIEIPDPKTPSPPPREPTPPPPTPPRPVTPLPDFISKHIGEEWFDHFFPGCSPETMEKPWTMAHFVQMLLRCLKEADHRYAGEIVEQLQVIQREHGLPHTNEVYRTLLGVFKNPSNPPTCLDPYGKDLLMSGLRLLHALNIWDVDFYGELMVQFIEGDKDVRNTCIDILHLCGMRDVHKHMEHELDAWEIWHLDEQERPTELRKMANAWLDKWMSSFKMHVKDTIERLKKGQNVQGRVVPGRGRGKTNSSQVRGILRRPGVDVITEDDENRATSRAAASRQTAASSRLTPGSSGRVTVTFESAPDASTLENATYIEAINYFVDMQTEKQLEVLQAQPTPQSPGEQQPTVHRNTVLVLPKLPGKSCLVRLGETHTSKCRPKRETSYAVDLRLPPLVSKKSAGRAEGLFAMPPAINLPLKTVNMNPFPSPIDAYDLPPEQPLLLTLRTAQKYFVPDRSFMPQLQQEQY